jgi:hypothetical protein
MQGWGRGVGAQDQDEFGRPVQECLRCGESPLPEVALGLRYEAHVAGEEPGYLVETFPRRARHRR